MLSYKTSYAIQILDLLKQSREGMSLIDIRNRFIFLPSKSFISGIVKQLESGRLICNASPKGTKYHIMSNLNEISLEDLVRLVDTDLVIGAPVGFLYWQPDYLKSRHHIEKVEKHLEDKISEIMHSVTIGKLLEPEKKKVKYLKLQKT